MYVNSVIVKYFLINLCNKINLIDVWRCEVLCKFVILIKKIMFWYYVYGYV